MSKLRKILLAALVFILIAPAALPQPINPYVLTSSKIIAALGYTPASNTGVATAPFTIGSTSANLIEPVSWGRSAVRDNLVVNTGNGITTDQFSYAANVNVLGPTGSAIAYEKAGALFWAQTNDPNSAITTSSTSGTVITVASVTSGAIDVGMAVTGTGVSANTVIVNQLTGPTGGTGTYTINNSQTLTSRTLTMATPNSGRNVAGSDSRGYIANTNPAGTAWGAVNIGFINSGGIGDGLIIGTESNAINNGVDQPLVSQWNSKYAFYAVSNGSNPATVAFFATGTGKWHHGLWMENNQFAGIGDDFVRLGDNSGGTLAQIDYLGAIKGASYTGGAISGTTGAFTGAVTSTVSGANFIASNATTPYYNATDGTRTLNVGVDSADSTYSGFWNSSTGLKLLVNSGSTIALRASSTGLVQMPNGFTATIVNAATTSSVCYNTATGAFTYDGTLGTCTVSALRFKDPISAIESKDALIGMNTLRPAIWRYKKDSNLDNRTHIGLYADDVEKMDKRCVGYDKDGKLQNYEDRCVIAYLAGAIKELKAMNDNLVVEVRELKRISK